MKLTQEEGAAMTELYRCGEIDIDVDRDLLWLHLEGIAGLLTKGLAERGTLVTKNPPRAHARRIVMSDHGIEIASARQS